ncbi:cytochrome P450 [Ramaria rubella]|nr:cytochrome P450 [Ramaria rubella]
MEYHIPLILLLITSVSLAFGSLRRRTRRGLRFPPGPPGNPFIGNLLQLPKASQWLTYANWKKTYGDVISVEAFGSRIIIVNSAKAASEIFEKRGGIYSDRPHNVMLHDLCGVVFQSYTEGFRSQRKLLNAALNSTAVLDYVQVQERETYALLDRLLESPEKFYKHVRRTAGAIILSISYGHAVVSDNDYYVQLSEATIAHTRRVIQPASFLVNLIPALKHVPEWMPFMGFRHFASIGRELNRKLREEPFDMVQAQMCQGSAPLSYTSRLLEAKGSMTNEEEYIKLTAATLYGAMVLHPDIQGKAQAEVDSIVGGNRLPTIADKDSLPYLRCVLSEVLRWQPVTALGVPHAAKQDDFYEGYLIPKGAAVISNIWHVLRISAMMAMVHDEAAYTDPMKFWPERFDGRFPDIKDPRSFVFGFGRRLCPGRYMAVNSIFIAMACLLSTYSFSKARDLEGNEIEPCIDYSLGPPKPFTCQITPRSKEAVAMIKATKIACEP